MPAARAFQGCALLRPFGLNPSKRYCGSLIYLGMGRVPIVFAIIPKAFSYTESWLFGWLAVSDALK